MPVNMQVKLNPAEMQRMLKSPTGMVGTHMQKLATQVILKAKANAPVRSGNLRRSIMVTRWPGPMNSIEVSANISYGLDVHEGTKAHVIKGNPILKFPSKKQGGRIVFAKSVKMPAHKGNPFLMKALSQVVRS